MTLENLEKEQKVEQKEEVARVQKILPIVQKEIDNICEKYDVKLMAMLKVLPDGIITEMALVNRSVQKKAINNPKQSNPYQA